MARYISTGIGICTLCCCWVAVVACLWSMIFSSKTVTNQLQSKTWPGSAQQQHDLIRDFKTIFSLRLSSTLFFFLLFVFSRARCVLSSLRGINEWIGLTWRGSIFFRRFFFSSLFSIFYQLRVFWLCPMIQHIFRFFKTTTFRGWKS